MDTARRYRPVQLDIAPSLAKKSHGLANHSLARAGNKERNGYEPEILIKNQPNTEEKKRAWITQVY